MAMIDPLVLYRLKIICGWFPLVVFRRQDTCGTNGAYSSPQSASQGKNGIFAGGRVVPNWVTVIQVNGGCYNPRMFSWFGKTRAAAALLLAVITLLGLGLAADSPVCAAQTPMGQQAASLISQAHAAAAAGRFADAIADYHAALRIAPRNVDAEIGLAQAYRGVRNFDAAKQTLEQARREHPKSAAPLAMLGDLDLELQTYDAAVAHLKAALALEPANVDARNRLAVAYKAKGDAADVAEALEQIAKVLARDPRNALAIYTRAEIYADQNRDALALPDAEKVVELQPQNPRGRALLGKILVRAPAGAAAEEIKQRCGRAVLALEPLLNMAEAPADAETLFLLSRAYRCAGQDERAAATLEQFEKSSQNDRTTKENQMQAKHLVQQADELAMKNDFAGSLAVLQQAIAMDATYPAAYSQLAKLYYSSGEIEKASDAIGQALQRAPYHPEYLYVQGKIFEKQGKMDDALGAFQRTVLVNPKESDAYFEMGWIYQQRGDLVKARAAYAKAVEISPDDPDYKRALATLNGRAAVTP
jgi:tetratricopeptide (TPR) repeat protein